MPAENFSHPRYWPAWLTIVFFRLVAALPWSLQTIIARGLAWTLYHTARQRRHIVEVNLKLCFPEWDDETRLTKVKEVIFNNALGIIETANAYYLPHEKLRRMVQVNGLEKLQQAKSQGKGVLLLGAHFSHLDLGGALISQFEPIYAIYRPHNNPLMDKFIIDRRLTFMRGVIDRRDMRGIARALKKNEVVWYPPDQDYGGKHSVFAPFFGVNAATITATTRLVRLNQSPVLTISYRREAGSQRYILDIEELGFEFPTGDDIQDAALVNRAMETLIRRAPTQYMWTHRRFKTQPEAKGALYKRDSRF